MPPRKPVWPVSSSPACRPRSRRASRFACCSSRTTKTTPSSPASPSPAAATPNTLDTVGDGAQAIEWLRGAGGSAGVDLVLVDLKMPVVDGFELLERMRAEHDLEKLAVVVLTTSGRMEDRERAHSLGAHAYVTKEASFPLYRDLLEALLSDVAT